MPPEFQQTGKPDASQPSTSGPPDAARPIDQAPQLEPPDIERDSEVNKELRRLNRALRALSTCNQALARATSEQELLNQICRIIVDVGGYRMAGIAYAENDAARTVRPVAHAGFDSGYLERIQLSWSDTPVGRGPSGTAIRENRICLVSDTANDPLFTPWREFALARGYAAVLCLPLRTAGTPFGVLAIYSGQANSFEMSEVELITEMANNLAFGITALRSQAQNRLANAALQEAEAKYRQLVEEVPAISYIAESGALGPFLYMSPQVETILGYRPESCMADPNFWLNHLHPDDRQQAFQEDTWEEGRPFQMEYRIRRHDGKHIWVRDEAVIVRDPHTGRRLTRGLLVDITEKKRAEEALRRSEESYRMFVAQSSEGIFRQDLDRPLPIDRPEDELVHRLLHESYLAECNNAMAKMYAFDSPQHLLGKRLTDLTSVDDPHNIQLTRDYVRNGFRIVDRVSQEMDSRGNAKIFLHSLFGVVEDGKLLHTWGIQRDITDRLQAEEERRKAADAFRENEERYRAFVQQSSEGIYRMEYNPPRSVPPASSGTDQNGARERIHGGMQRRHGEDVRPGNCSRLDG